MKGKNVSIIFSVSFLGVFLGLIAFGHLPKKVTPQTAIPVQLASYVAPAPPATHGSNVPFDFTEAAAKSTDAVVHIKTKINPTPSANKSHRNPYQDLFGDDFYKLFGDPYAGNMPQEASGSGVIVDASGYIVTNNHVVEDADEIEVTLHNNSTYKAVVIGKDKDFDLAVLKIEATNIPTITFGNSDSVRVGQWCLAVGNPFNLTSTVTAGIVSAKGRNINILEGNGGGTGNTAIESFIQTDAAVNPGNSGGALVNTDGELIGINTAIASTTGAYAGYAFAVPSNLVFKVYNDLRNFGVVQRGYLGVNIRSVDDALAKELNLKSIEGVYVENVIKESAAEEAGLKSKDVITKINGVSIKTAPELQEQVGRYRPGDKIAVIYIRDGKEATANVTLKNKFNSTNLVDDGKELLNSLGAQLTTLSKPEAMRYGIQGGVKVSDIKDGKIKQYTEIGNGFIITFMNEKPVNSVEDIAGILATKKGNITIEGIYPGKPFSFLYAIKN